MQRKNDTIFTDPIVIKKQHTHELLSGILVFIVLPIFNCLIVMAGQKSALYNSLSRLAWPEGLLWLIYIWGILNIGCFVYVSELTIRTGGYTKRFHKLFVILEIMSAIIMTGGVSIRHMSIAENIICCCKMYIPLFQPSDLSDFI